MSAVRRRSVFRPSDRTRRCIGRGQLKLCTRVKTVVHARVKKEVHEVQPDKELKHRTNDRLSYCTRAVFAPYSSKSEK